MTDAHAQGLHDSNHDDNNGIPAAVDMIAAAAAAQDTHQQQPHSPTFHETSDDKRSSFGHHSSSTGGDDDHSNTGSQQVGSGSMIISSVATTSSAVGIGARLSIDIGEHKNIDSAPPTSTSTPKKSVSFAGDAPHGDGTSFGTGSGSDVPLRKVVAFGSDIDSQRNSNEKHEEDSRVKKSEFVRQKTKLRIVSANASNHYGWFSLAIIQLVIRCVATIATWMLIGDLLTRSGSRGVSHPAAAAGLIIIHLLVAFTQMEFDWLNLGRNQYWWADILHARTIVEFVFYYRDWRRHQNKPWANRDFRSAVSFESFLGNAPSLIVQALVALQDLDHRSWIQALCLIVTILSTLIDLFHFFKYVSASWETYTWMMGKAIINTASRTILVAFLIDSLKRWVWIWILLSYILSILIYFGSVKMARRNKRDDPLLFKWCHVAFGGLVACHMTFISIPFAPTHAIIDWWWGYLASEFKIIVENACMLAATAVLIDRDHDLLYWSAIFFAGCIFIANIVALVFMHRSVTKQLQKRNLYSSTLIVKLFAYLCTHLKLKLSAKKAAKEGMQSGDDEEEVDTHDAEVSPDA